MAVALVAAHTVAVHAEQPNYDLAVAFDIAQAKIIGTAVVEAAPGAQLSIYRGDLRILHLTTGGRDVALGPKDPEPFTLRAEGPVRIRYEGMFSDPEGDVIGRDTILLRGMWYPVVEGWHRYRVTATVPRGFEAFSEAESVRRTDSAGETTFVFDLPHPQRDWDGVTFIASKRWTSRRARHNDVEVSVHVLTRNGGRPDELIRRTRRHLQRLEGLLGKYPFNRLAIVENPVPLGYSVSMPTYVVLTQQSVAAEGAEDSALNHEIAHQWFGNGVLADYEGGNWAEGLASYFSDLLEAERSGTAWERRQRMMAGYQNNVADRAASPLSKFSESSDRVSKFIGYGKSALVFHMLRRQLGDELFFAATRRFVAQNLFRAASWSDIRRACEQEASADLGWFFAQWVGGVATPELGLEGVSVSPAGGKHELRFTVTQKPQAFVLTVPVTFRFEHGRHRTVVLQFSGERTEFRYLMKEKPVQIVLDESYDVFRRLTPPEIPPRIDTLLTRQRLTLMAPPGEADKFGAFIDAFEREGIDVALYGPEFKISRKRRPSRAWSGATSPWRQLQTQRAAAGTPATQMTRSSLILLGEGHPLIARLFGHVDLPRGGFTVTVVKHPQSPGDVVAIVTAVSKQEVDAAFGKLFARRRFSVAVFNGGKLTSYELHAGERGIASDVVSPPR